MFRSGSYEPCGAKELGSFTPASVQAKNTQATNLACLQVRLADLREEQIRDGQVPTPVLISTSK
jgi:hypothetical protein